jgi:MarR family transcriptional regulator for hemolysin
MKRHDEYSFERSLGRMTTVLSRAILSNISRELPLGGVKLSSEEWVVLIYVGNHEGRTQCDLAAMIFKDRPAMSRMTDKLARMGLVRRKKDGEDSRARRLFITPRGRETMRRASEIVYGILAVAEAGISEEELLVCKKVLHKVHANLTGAKYE